MTIQPLNLGLEVLAKEPPKKKEKSLFLRLFNKKRLQKPNKVAIVYLRNNGRAEMYDMEAKNGFFTINGKTYHEDKDCMYSITKERIPLAVITEWSLLPIGTETWREKEMLEKFTELEDHVLKGIRHAELVKLSGQESKGMDRKTMIILGILAVIGIAFATQYI